MSCSIFNFNKKSNKENEITYMGKKNKTEFPEFIRYCLYDKTQLKNQLLMELFDYYNGRDVVVGNGFIYVRGTTSILLTAHMDTVHKETVKDYYEEKKDGKHIISSPQGIGGDDRCGIYMIMEILKTTDLRPYILFCEDEEIGGIGSGKFCQTSYADEMKKLNYMIELDRANRNDAVFYDCGNKEFKDYICGTTGYEEEIGSFSDICNLSEDSDIASVNLSCGYYNAHTVAEYVIVEEMLATIQTVKDLLGMEKADSLQYDYQEVKYYKNWGYNSLSSYSKYYNDYKLDDEDDESESCILLRVITTNENPKTSDEEFVYFEEYGATEDECWVSLFMNNPYMCFNDILDYEVYNL